MTIRTLWDAALRRLHIEPQRGDSTVLCSGCAQPGVRVVTGTWRDGVLGVLRGMVFHAWCWPCWALRSVDEPGRWGVLVWWLPDPTTGTTTWNEVHDELPQVPPGCCGCGGRGGPTRYAVWAADSRRCDFETYCGRCFTQTLPNQWTAGCTWADIGEVFTVLAARTAAEDRWPARRPVGEVPSCTS